MEPVCHPGQRLFRRLEEGRLRPLGALFDKLGDIQRRGQQRDGEQRHPPVQQKQRPADQHDLKGDLPEQRQHTEPPGTDGVRLAGVLRRVLPLRATLEGHVVPPQDALEHILLQGRDAARSEPVPQPPVEVEKQYLAQNIARQGQAVPQRPHPLARDRAVQHLALEELQRHPEETGGEHTNQSPYQPGAVLPFIFFHLDLLLQYAIEGSNFISFYRLEGSSQFHRSRPLLSFIWGGKGAFPALFCQILLYQPGRMLSNPIPKDPAPFQAGRRPPDTPKTRDKIPGKSPEND